MAGILQCRYAIADAILAHESAGYVDVAQMLIPSDRGAAAGRCLDQIAGNHRVRSDKLHPQSQILQRFRQVLRGIVCNAESCGGLRSGEDLASPGGVTSGSCGYGETNPDASASLKASGGDQIS